jgi:hypothetical protein
MKLSAYISGPAGLFLFIFFFIPWVSITCAIPFFLDETSVMNASGYELATGQSADEFAVKSCELTIENSATLAGLGGGFASPDNPLGAIEGLEGADLGAVSGAAFDSCEDITFDDFFADTGTTASTDPLAAADEATSADLDRDAFDPIQADARLWLIPIVALGAMLLAGVRGVGLLDGMFTGTGLILLTIGGAVVLVLKYLEFQDLSDYLQTALESTEESDTGNFSVTGGAALNYEGGWFAAIVSLVAIFIAGVVGFFEDEPGGASSARSSAAPPPEDIPEPDSGMFDISGGTVGRAPSGGKSKRPSWLDD